jgi:hypothetical protein
LLQRLNAPTLDQVLQRIADDANRSFVVNVQNSSTIDLDTAPDKLEVTEFMNAMGQLMSGLQPMMQFGPQGFEAAKAMLVGVSERFKFGQQIGEKIRLLQPPPPPQPVAPAPEENPALQKAQTEAELEKIALERELNREKMLLEKERIQAEREKMRIDVAKAQLQLQSLQAKTTVQNAPVRN